MFAMQYTGTVNPNLLKGTSNEWSEWKHLDSLNYDNWGEEVFASNIDPISNENLAASVELQIRNIQFKEGKKLDMITIDTDYAWLYPVILFSDNDNNGWWSTKQLFFNNGKYRGYQDTITTQDTTAIWIGNTSLTSNPTITATRVRFEIHIQYAACDVRFRRLKLEQGTVATPWCKHVDD